MKITHCLRCQSTNLQEGTIYEYAQNYYVEPMRIHWKAKPNIMADSAPLSAIVCKACGHIELVIDPYIAQEPCQHQCPHCKAVYYYRIADEAIHYKVKCQNCGKEFQIQEKNESKDVLDAIEEDLREKKGGERGIH
ncbi:MAG: hypothetical protein E4H14_10390 [Candidatus Thorarchaeota archaeon]|nr:MAG: hypothetical protein E4H14_10390 [Candidatus Thorarchaeota archaeon]